MNEKLNKSFTVLTICRADLTPYIGEQTAGNIDDADMERIADKVGDTVLDCGYWDALRGALEYMELLPDKLAPDQPDKICPKQLKN